MMGTYIHKKLDAITMYRVVIYGLSVITLWGFALSLFGVSDTTVRAYVLSLLVLVAGAMLAHTILTALFKAPGNSESSLITALILFLILEPSAERTALLILFGIGALSIALKYAIALHKRHIFNPVAITLVVVGLFGFGGGGWWVGSRYMLPIVAVVGFLIVLKTGRERLAVVYIMGSTAVAVLSALWSHEGVVETIMQHFLSWPMIFLATVMLTEPLSLPSTKRRQDVYALIAIVCGGSFPFAIGPLYATPELGLIVANLYTTLFDRQKRLTLSLISRTLVGAHTYEYQFQTNEPTLHIPGQYMEWTLPHAKPDMRGIRRYFTVTSLPGKTEIAFAVRHLEKQSTWKRALETLPLGGIVYTAQRAGEFTLHGKKGPFVFIAGGIGITPFITMMRHARHTERNLNVTLFYCNKTEADVAFGEEVRDGSVCGVKSVHVFMEAPSGAYVYEVGYITKETLEKYVTQWKEATFFISGPPGLVSAYDTLLQSLKIPSARIVTDYFPGLS